MEADNTESQIVVNPKDWSVSPLASTIFQLFLIDPVTEFQPVYGQDYIDYPVPKRLYFKS